jgi:dTDP-4-dehydrorhamnose reductase
MRILVLGGDGMLGHRLYLDLAERHEVRVTLHRSLAHYASLGLYRTAATYDGVDVRDTARVGTIVDEFRPDAVINATGIVKQRDAASQSIPSIEINALFPHRLCEICRHEGSRLLHISTDCVFSGQRGNYSESDVPDATDLYGLSKRLGEVAEAPAITLRTSIIGRELSRRTGLLEWFLAQKSPVKGYRNAIFSGFTTIEMSRIVERVLQHPVMLNGVYHVSSTAINKHDLLCLIRDKLRLSVDIIADDTFKCDRSLDSTRFRQSFGYSPPSWDSMVAELANTRNA